MKTRANVYLIGGLLLSLSTLSSSVSDFTPSYLYYFNKTPTRAVAIFYLAPTVVSSNLTLVDNVQLRQLAELGELDAHYQLALRFLQQGNPAAAKLWWQSEFDNYAVNQQQALADNLIAQQQWQSIEWLWQTNRLPQGDARQAWLLRQRSDAEYIKADFAKRHNFSLSLHTVSVMPQCKFNVLMLTDHHAGINALKSFKRFYQAKPEPEKNSFCFSEIVYVGDQFSCRNHDMAVQCNWENAVAYNWPAGFDFIVMMSESGAANVVGGIMHINSQQSYQVFLHELMHFNGFEDEYPLPEKKQQWLCKQQGKVAPNLFIANDVLPPSGWQKSRACKNSMAYKPSPNWSIMQYQTMALSQQYRQLWQKQINQPLTKPIRFIDYFTFLGVKPTITTTSSLDKFSD